MTHLRIEQNTTGTEEVSHSIISKLYELAYSGTLDNTSNLQGRLHTPSAYTYQITYLTTNYPNLYITADRQYHHFVDPEVERIMATTYGDGTGITLQEMQARTTLANDLFDGNTTITSLNDLQYFTGITKLNRQFARRASNLTSVIIPGNVVSIGEHPGYGDPSSHGSFRETSLTNVTLNEGLLCIGPNTFNTVTTLTTIDIPSTVTKIDMSAFMNCSNLISVTGGENITCNASSSSFNTSNNPGGVFLGCLKLESLSDFDFSTWVDIPQNMFYNCLKLNFGTQLNNLPNLVTINPKAFGYCKLLANIDLSNVTKIDDEAFSNCTGLTTLDLSNVTSIGRSSFIDCKNLTSITALNNNVVFTGDSSFYNCENLQSISLPSSVTTIRREMFYHCKNLTTIGDTSHITVIARNAFNSCNKLLSLNLSNLDTTSNVVKSAFKDDWSFEWCKELTTLGKTTFPNITLMSPGVFYHCEKLEGELNFPDLTSILTGGYQPIFHDCKKLTKISLGHPTLIGVLGIGYNTNERGPFVGCTSLKIVNLGDSVTTLCNYCFYGCTSLKAVIINTSSVPYTDTNGSRANNSLYDMFYTENAYIYVPDAAVNTYKNTLPYSNFPDHILPISQYNELTILAS